MSFVSRHNGFGHPAPTIKVLQLCGAEVHRADEDAAVSVVCDGSIFAASLLHLDRMKRL